MADFEHRLFLNDSPASAKQLEKIAEITVEQEVCLAWEARVKIPITLD